MHYAAFEGHQVVCRTLLESGAKIDQTDNDGKPPLMLAAEEGHSDLVSEFLKNYGAPPDQKAHDGRTALRYYYCSINYKLLTILNMSCILID